MKTSDYIGLGFLGIGTYFLFKKGFFDGLFTSTPMLNREGTDIITQTPKQDGEQGTRLRSSLNDNQNSLIKVPSMLGQTTTYKLPQSSLLSPREQKAISKGNYFIDVTKNTISTNPLMVGLSKAKESFIKSNSISYAQSSLTPNKMVAIQNTGNQTTTYKGSSSQIALQTAINKTSSTLKTVGSSALKTAATAVTSTANLFSKAATTAISKAKSLKSSKKK